MDETSLGSKRRNHIPQLLITGPQMNGKGSHLRFKVMSRTNQPFITSKICIHMLRSDVFESIDGSNKNLSQCVINQSIKNKQSNSSPQNHTTKLRSGDTGAASVGFNFWCLAQMKFTTHSFRAWNSLRFLRAPPHVDARESKKPSTFPGKSTKKSVVSQGVHLLLTFKGIIFSD